MCVFLTNIFSTMFLTSLILRLELLPFEFLWGSFFLAFSPNISWTSCWTYNILNDGRLAHAALNCLPAATYGSQWCKILTRKSHYSHETKLLNLLHDNLWTSNKNIIYIIHHFFLVFNHAPKKLKHNEISVVWLKTSCIFFWAGVLFVIELLLN